MGFYFVYACGSEWEMKCFYLVERKIIFLLKWTLEKGICGAFVASQTPEAQCQRFYPWPNVSKTDFGVLV